MCKFFQGSKYINEFFCVKTDSRYSKDYRPTCDIEKQTNNGNCKSSFGIYTATIPWPLPLTITGFSETQFKTPSQIESRCRSAVSAIPMRLFSSLRFEGEN